MPASCTNLRLPPLLHNNPTPTHLCRASSSSCPSRKLVLEIKERLHKEYPTLPVGRNGRDDEDMILWFLKDRKFHVDNAVAKLTKTIKWRQEFGVSDLSQESVQDMFATGKSYLHEHTDVRGRQVLVVVSAKHFPSVHDPIESQKLCVFLVEKALANLSAGKEEVLGIFDLRGFGTQNADISFLKFVIDVFHTHYPRRLGEVLFVDAPFVFGPVWHVVKPWLKSYASLVRFCSRDTVCKEYFTPLTVPLDFTS